MLSWFDVLLHDSLNVCQVYAFYTYSGFAAIALEQVMKVV